MTGWTLTAVTIAGIAIAIVLVLACLDRDPQPSDEDLHALAASPYFPGEGRPASADGVNRRAAIGARKADRRQPRSPRPAR